jgi:hypothetical protein
MDPDSIRSMDPYPDPYSESGSGIGIWIQPSRRTKVTLKIEKKIGNFILQSWMFFFEG